MVKQHLDDHVGAELETSRVYMRHTHAAPCRVEKGAGLGSVEARLVYSGTSNHFRRIRFQYVRQMHSAPGFVKKGADLGRAEAGLIDSRLQGIVVVIPFFELLQFDILTKIR